MTRKFQKSILAAALLQAIAAGSAFAGGPEGFIALPQIVTQSPSNNVAPIGPNRPLLGKTDDKNEFAPNRIILKFKDSSWTRGFVYGKGSANPAMLANTLQLSAESQNALSQAGARVVKAMPGMGLMVAEIAEHNKRSLGRAIEALYRSGAIEFAHPDFIVKTQKTPNDTDFAALWGLHNTGQTGGVADADIDAPEAWNKRIGSKGSVVVGVIDTGVDYSHPDLTPNMWANPGEIPGNGIDDEGNGYIDDVYGIDAHNADTDPMDDNGHGTHVSGTIGARGNNNSQVVGVNWTADIMALKFLDASGSGSTSDAITLIDYAIDTKTRHALPRMVLNNSWGGGGFSPALEAAIAASRDNGILFVAAAGNDNTDNDVFPHYPSSYDVDNIVSVGSTDAMDYRSWFSNYGCSSVDIFAPGSDILSTVPGGGLASYSGTSMATPHVAGAAALLWAQNPSFNWRTVKAALINGADTKPALSEHSLNGSRLNVNNSMASSTGAAPSLWAVSPAIAGPGEDVIIKGNRFGTSAGSVLIRGVSVPIKKWTNTAITVTLPSDMNYGAGKVIVTDAAGAATKGACFQVSTQAKVVDATLIPRAWHAGAKVGNNYWIFGGETHWGATGLVELYTPGTGKKVIDSDWTMPVTVSNALAVQRGTLVYVIGGIDWSTGSAIAVNTVQIFDTSTRTWSMGTPLPAPMAQLGGVALSDGIYIFGGLDSSLYAPTDKVYRFNTTTKIWEALPAMPTSATYASVVRAGTTDTAWVMSNGEAYTYDATSGIWTFMDHMNDYHTAGVALWWRNQPNILSGSSESGELWDGTKWVTAYQTPYLYTVTGGLFNDVAYLLNGYDGYGVGFSNTVWSIKR